MAGTAECLTLVAIVGTSVYKCGRWATVLEPALVNPQRTCARGLQ